VVKKVIGEELIDICHGGRDSFPLKPDPASTLDILSELSGEKEISAFVGDTSVDIATGKAAGLHTIGVKWGFRTEKELKEAGAEFIVDSADELLDIIKNL
jgi:phosphoglycolate phosphatase